MVTYLGIFGASMVVLPWPFAVFAFDQTGIQIGIGLPWSRRWSANRSVRWTGLYSEIKRVVFDGNFFVISKGDGRSVTVRAPSSSCRLIESELASKGVLIEKSRLSRFFQNANAKL
jgi:hypothetical protein